MRYLIYICFSAFIGCGDLESQPRHPPQPPIGIEIKTCPLEKKRGITQIYKTKDNILVGNYYPNNPNSCSYQGRKYGRTLIDDIIITTAKPEVNCAVILSATEDNNGSIYLVKEYDREQYVASLVGELAYYNNETKRKVSQYCDFEGERYELQVKTPAIAFDRWNRMIIAGVAFTYLPVLKVGRTCYTLNYPKTNIIGLSDKHFILGDATHVKVMWLHHAQIREGEVYEKSELLPTKFVDGDTLIAFEGRFNDRFGEGRSYIAFLDEGVVVDKWFPSPKRFPQAPLVIVNDAKRIEEGWMVGGSVCGSGRGWCQGWVAKFNEHRQVEWEHLIHRQAATTISNIELKEGSVYAAINASPYCCEAKDFDYESWILHVSYEGGCMKY